MEESRIYELGRTGIYMGWEFVAGKMPFLGHFNDFALGRPNEEGIC